MSFRGSTNDVLNINRRFTYLLTYLAAPRYIIYERSYSLSKLSLPRQPLLIVVKLDWHHLIARPQKSLIHANIS